MSSHEHFLRYVDDATGGVQQIAVPGGSIAAYVAKSPHREGPNEDSALIAPLTDDTLVLCVCDGAGGLRAGDEASRITVDSLAEALDTSEDPVAAILRAFDRAHREILASATGGATTIAGVLIHDHHLRSFHAGDSMALVMGQRGRRKLITTSHSPVGYAVESGLIDEQEAILHDRLHIVSNLIGITEARIELSSTIEVAPRDTVVVASDGLFDNLLVDEVIEYLRKGPLAESVAAMVAEATRRMLEPAPNQPSKPDDLTVIAYRPIVTP